MSAYFQFEMYYARLILLLLQILLKCIQKMTDGVVSASTYYQNSMITKKHSIDFNA